MEKEKIKKHFEEKKETVSKKDLKKTLENEDEILEKAKVGHLQKFVQEINIMFDMIKDYWNGSYREISWGTIASIVVALLYIFSPIDLIPDFIPGIGLLDDAFVVTLCLSMINYDMKKYKEFKRNQSELNNGIVEDL